MGFGITVSPHGGQLALSESGGLFGHRQVTTGTGQDGRCSQADHCRDLVQPVVGTAEVGKSLKSS
jgi:hypothetical protein